MLRSYEDQYTNPDGATTRPAEGQDQTAQPQPPKPQAAQIEPVPNGVQTVSAPSSSQTSTANVKPVAAAPMIPPPPPPPPTYETPSAVPGGVQTYYANGSNPGAAPTAPLGTRSNPDTAVDAARLQQMMAAQGTTIGDPVVKAGTVGIDGAPRTYDYIEGRNNPDPVSGFATDPSLAYPKANDVNDDLARRQSAWMAEQYSAGNQFATGDQMPANYQPSALVTDALNGGSGIEAQVAKIMGDRYPIVNGQYRDDAAAMQEAERLRQQINRGEIPYTGNTLAPVQTNVGTSTPGAPAAAAGNTGIVPNAPAATPQGPSQRDLVLSQILQSIFSGTGPFASKGTGATSGTSAGPSPSVSMPNRTASPFKSAEVVGIDPNDDLRDKMILPGQDQMLEDARQKMFSGVDKLNGFDRNGRLNAIADAAFGRYGAGADSIDPTASARLEGYGQRVDQAAGKLADVDRLKLAMDAWKTFADETNPEYDLAMKKATQRAAAAGGSRSGMLRTEYGNLADRRAQQLDTEKRRLVQDAITGSIDDQFRKTDTLAGLEGALADREAGYRTERRGERDRVTALRRAADLFGADQADAEAGDLSRGFEASRGVFGDVANEGARRRSELRGEREFQTGQEQQAYDRSLNDWQMARTTSGDNFSRAMQLLGAGEAGNPSDILAQLSKDGGLDPQTIAMLAASLGNRQGYGGGGATQQGAPAGGGGGLNLPDLSGINDVLAGIDWSKFPGASPAPAPAAYPADPEF